MPTIAISGSHSTGKSSLIEQLKKTKRIANKFKFEGEVLRDIKKRGFNINEMGTDATQVIVLSKFLELSACTDTILDRCALDGLVYTSYLYEKNQVKKTTLRIAEAIFQNVRYDMHFYIPPEFDIISDGIRSENIEFRNRITELFEEYIEAYSLQVVRLTGSIEERADQFMRVLDSYYEWAKDSEKAQIEFMKSLSNLK